MSSKLPNHYTRKGELTSYALSCGYVEQTGKVRLWREHGVYQISYLDSDTGKHLRASTRYIADARATYRRWNCEVFLVTPKGA